jgi:hypothetical protein
MKHIRNYILPALTIRNSEIFSQGAYAVFLRINSYYFPKQQ